MFTIFCDHYADFIVQLSQKAVALFAVIFGSQNLVYNVHLFQHIFRFVRIYGPLDRFSCFPFESYLGRLKRLIRGPQPPAVQLYKRLTEHAMWEEEIHIQPLVDDCGAVLPTHLVRAFATKSSTRFIHKGVVYSTKAPDNAVLIDGRPAKLVRFSDGILHFKSFSSCEPFFTDIICSSDLFIFQCANPCDDVQTAPISSLHGKCICFPVPYGFVLCPLALTVGVPCNHSY